jgi:ribosomal-protein-alanine N-acetyltransferase
MLAANRTSRYEKLLVCSNLDGRILGYIAVNEIVRGALLGGYLGYWIGAAHARQGYMTEALELMLRHAFGALGLHRVEANIIPGNQPSIRLVAQAGFRKEAVSKRYLKIAGRWQDHERWALVREEFLGRSRRPRSYR